MVIYIHGIGSHPPKDELKLEWDNALFGKPMRGQTSMAYWSDILHGRPTSAAVRARSLGDRAGGGDSSDEIDLDAILDDASVPEAKRSDAAARSSESRNRSPVSASADVRPPGPDHVRRFCPCPASLGDRSPSCF